MLAIDSADARVLGYVAAAALAIAWGTAELRVTRRGPSNWWPAYWWTSAIVFVTMAIARASELGDFVGELGRDQARSSGWYEGRRVYQGAAVVVIAAVWFIGVVVAVWRVPPRRRRYLPHAVGLSSLLAFAAIRIVSLHQVDALLYRRHIGDVRIVTVTEFALLAVTVTAGLVGAPLGRRRAR
jgi:hypothetical protein